MTLTDAMLVYHGEPTGKGVKTTMVLNPDFIARLLGLPTEWSRVSEPLASQLWGTRSQSRKL